MGFGKAEQILNLHKKNVHRKQSDFLVLQNPAVFHLAEIEKNFMVPK
jgi:hypothetical protein